MGLGISAYRQIKKLDEENDDCCRLTIIPEFAERADGLEEGVYSFTEAFNFQAGSYSGYNEWRNQLAQLAGWKDDNAAWQATEGPFWELINFADNEGTIGPKTAAKLAQDFSDFQAKADKHSDHYWREKYDTWRKALEM